jgi:hypothetical protein
MSQDQGSQQSDKTTANTPVSGTDPGGTRPAPKGGASGAPAKPPVQSGDANVNTPRGTDR